MDEIKVDPNRPREPGMDELLVDPNPPRERFFAVETHPHCAAKILSEAHERTLTLLVVKLIHIADDIEPDTAGIRCIALTTRTRLNDGTYLEPLRAYYRISDDGKTAIVLDAQELKRNGVVKISQGDMIETIRAEVIKEISERRRG